MTDISLLPDELFIEQAIETQAQLLSSTIWTDQLVVRLGAEIGSSKLVAVPEAERQYPAQVYYTTLDGREVGKAINTETDWRYGRRVTIGYPPNDKARLHVMGTAISSELSRVAEEVGVPPHAEQHSVRNLGIDGGSYEGKVGEDVVMVDARQMWNLGIQPWDGLTAYVPKGMVHFGSALQYWGGDTTTDFTAYVPGATNRARYALISIDRDLVLQYIYGAVFDVQFASNPPSFYVPEGDANTYRIGAVLLLNGMTAINWAHIVSGFNVLAQPDLGHIYRYIELRLFEIERRLSMVI